MAEEEESEIDGGLASMDSTESRWVFQDEDDSEIEDDYDEDDDASQRTANTAAALDSEDEDDNAEQRLIRTGPRIDSFDVEALEIPGAVRNEYEVMNSFSFLKILRYVELL
nr:potassium transporter 7 [Quercus suber]